MILVIFGTLFPLIFLCLILFQFISHLLDQDRDAKYGGLYSVVGPYYHIKYYIFLLMLKIKRYKNRSSSESETFIDINEIRNNRIKEMPHDLDERDAIDSVYFYCGGDMVNREMGTNKRVDIIIRFARRRGRVGEFWMVVKQSRGPVLVHPNCPETSIINCSRLGWRTTTGLFINCDRPNEKWTIKYQGWLKEDTVEGKPVHVNIKLCFRAFCNTIDSHQDSSDHLVADFISRERWSRHFFDLLKNFAENNQTHYEQWGSYNGYVNIDRQGELVLKHCKGYRDHSFGIRNWNQYQRYGAIFGYLENGACFSLGSVCCRNTLSHIRYGYYVTPFGDVRPITDHNFNLWEVFLSSPPKTKVVIEFFAGKKYNLEITMNSETNFNVNRGKSIIIERFIECKMNNIPGKGVNEFCASDAVPPYKQHNPLSIEILGPCSMDGSEKFCLSLEDEESRNRNVSGGKGCQLADLVKIYKTFGEINVPPGVVVTIKAYKDFLQMNSNVSQKIATLSASLRKSAATNVDQLCKDIEDAIVNGQIPTNVRDSITTELELHFTDDLNSEFFSVRSSAAEEDSSGSSSAGQMATFLGVRGLDNIMIMIKKCWASQFSLTAVSYRIRNGQPINAVMAVIVMRMVPADISGVMFTVNPVNGDSTRMIISATTGLGESLVSGKCEPDNIEVERLMDGSLKIISQSIGSKTLRIDVDYNQGNTVEIEMSNQDVLCISEKEILDLAKLGILIEKCYGEPCDIEWAKHEGMIYILQTRPITTLNTESDEDIIQEFDSALSYDNECLTTSNIGEMMPLATTPLTLSLFGSAIEKSFQATCTKTGIISRSSSVRRFLCSFSNHLFLNIHCMSLLSDISELDNLFVAILGRVVEKPSKNDISRFTEGSSLFRQTYSKILKFMSIRRGHRNTKEWEAKFQNGYAIQSKKNTKLQMAAILDQIKDYFKCWDDTIANTSGAALWNLVLMRLLKDETGWGNNLYCKIAELLSSCSNVVSADVPNSLKKIAITIGKNEQWKHIILNGSDASCLDWLTSVDSKEVGKLFQEFLEKHGHRCIREAEFQEDSWKRSPLKVSSVIKVMVTNLTENDYIIKREFTPEMALDNLHLNLNFVKKKVLQKVLIKTREGVGSREWGKSISIQMCEAFKQAFIRLDKLMIEESLIQDQNLIYYFTFDELVTFIMDQDGMRGSLLNRAQRRKRLFANQMKLSMPEICFGSPYDDMNEFLISGKEKNQMKYSGTPVSIGRVSGICRVITKLEEAAEIKPGEILVVPYTDVGWTPYFPLLAGLITEKGSVLSHGAVVAREYGLPCLVGLSGATKILNTGNHILLNASEGFVELVND